MNRTALVSLLIVAGALVTAVASIPFRAETWSDRGGESKLKFSHRLHVTDASIACENCHNATKSTKAADNLRSTHENCTSCHEEQINNKCDYCHTDPENIEALPAEDRALRFSHAQHVVMKNVECATCHAGLANVELAGPANMPAMDACATCHNDRKAPTACESCHTSLAGLLPADHLAAGFRREHGFVSRVGGLETECATCHTQTFCADCHAPAGLMSFGKTGKMADPTPKNSPSNAPSTMTLQKAHDMNYRFTHGLDAKSHRTDCYSCHSAQEFCAECHEAGGVTGGIKPAWHLGAGFTTLGVGSGGGRHAIEARRDIESCISCHDVQGTDATCVTCHMDADGFKGTDPKTHPAGYMSGDGDGSWHTNGGATCYNCHTDLNAHPGGARGKGFCGYCHR